VKFKTIYADPPWPETGGGRIRRGADRHYPLMSVADIMSLPVANVAADNAHIYMWTTNNFLGDAFAVMDAWEFRYVTMITWTKPKIGLGQYFRGLTEHCLFGVRGMLPYKVVDGKRQQGVTWINGDYRGHSFKPAAMRKMIEKVSYGPRLELFARERFPGWKIWGSEFKNDVELI
jgi:N6-adenosine-specific RNA methylase IME4